jgi:hypothetical protein
MLTSERLSVATTRSTLQVQSPCQFAGMVPISLHKLLTDIQLLSKPTGKGEDPFRDSKRSPLFL